jgi:hypothetical protein
VQQQQLDAEGHADGEHDAGHLFDRSLRGSRNCPGANVMPTPPGCTDTPVSWTTEMTPLRVRATA